MPDHLHLLWVGILDKCDQRHAARFFRRQMNLALARLGVEFQKQGVEFQKQPYEHVLKDEERQETAFAAVACGA